MLYVLLYAGLALVLFLIFKIKRMQTYWTRQGVYQIEPEFLFGNTRGMMLRTKSWAQHYLEFYRHVKSKGLRFAGVYLLTAPILLVVDPELAKTILVKDFDYFMDHGTYVNEEAEPLTAHLFNLEGQRWKNLRIKMTPTFTSGKMKMMFQTFVACTRGLSDIVNEYAVQKTPLDIKDVLARFTTDIIGSCAFGVECNSLKNPDSEFIIQGKRSFYVGPSDAIKVMIANTIPTKMSNFFGIKVVRPEVDKFFMNMIKDTVEYREKNNIYRKDFMHLLLQLKNQGKVTDEEHIISNNQEKLSTITLNELAAQCFVFFLAGHETSSTTMTFTLFELASNLDIQDKLRKEIISVLSKYNNEITYEAIMEMTYLENVIFEALRKYPPLSVIIRQSNKPYKIPESNIVIEKGSRINISILGMQRDPEYFPDPEKFDPDRFTEENRSKRHPYTWMPFGEGPRQCIGMRFGLIQSKVGLVTILQNYTVSVNEKTKVPLDFDPSNWMTSAKGDIWLDIKKV